MHPPYRLRCFTNAHIRSASIYAGETVDAARDGFSPIWSLPSYTNAAIFTPSPLTTSDVVQTQMVAQPSDPIRIVQYVAPVAMWTNSRSGHLVTIYDLGQNIVGWCNVSLVNTGASGWAGSSVTLQHAESLELDENNLGAFGPSHGNIYTGNLLGAPQIDRYYLTGDSSVLLHPHFTYHGFRYVEVWCSIPEVAASLSLSSITGCVIRSSVRGVGNFWCSDTNACDFATNLVSKLVTNAIWGIGGNLQGVFTACTQRYEREGYLYDEHIASQTACFGFDMGSFYTKTSRDIRDAQATRADGSYPIYAPYDALPLLSWDTYYDPGCMAGGLVFPWRLYQNYADLRVLAEHYASAQKWFGYLAHSCTNGDGSWGTGFWESHVEVGDWQCGDHFSGTGGLPSDWQNLEGRAGSARQPWGAAWCAFSADTLAAMSQQLQRVALAKGNSAAAASYGSDYAYYTNQAARIRQAYALNLSQYYEGPSVTNTSQSDCIKGLYFDMVPQSARGNLITNVLLGGYGGVSNYNKYCSDGTKGSNHLSTGYISSREMLELTRNGLTSKAYDVLTNTAFPSFLYSVINGATTCWESWNTYVSGPRGGYRDASFGSLNHLPLGAVTEWIWRVVGGVNPDESHPGFENVIIKPEPGGGITNCFVAFDSIAGRITCAWTNDAVARTYAIELTVPANATASVLLPCTNLLWVSEGKGPATSAIGLLAAPYTTNDVSFPSGATLFQVGSGHYSFAVTNFSF